MTKTYDGFEGLHVYQSARNYRQKISLLCKELPASEKFLLKDQLIRSSRSITANIAEVMAVFTLKSLSNFADRPEDRLLKL